MIRTTTTVALGLALVCLMVAQFAPLKGLAGSARFAEDGREWEETVFSGSFTYWTFHDDLTGETQYYQVMDLPEGRGDKADLLGPAAIVAMVAIVASGILLHFGRWRQGAFAAGITFLAMVIGLGVLIDDHNGLPWALFDQAMYDARQTGNMYGGGGSDPHPAGDAAFMWTIMSEAFVAIGAGLAWFLPGRKTASAMPDMPE